MIKFSKYMEASKKLMYMLFEKNIIEMLNNTSLKSIDWKGIDIDNCGITATFPNIKDRFNHEWIDYFKEKNITALDLFLASVFHFGYKQGIDNKIENKRNYIEIIENIRNKMNNYGT